MAKKKDALLDHNFDGIQELDNDLPPWWLWLFYISIIISVAYILHYHVFDTGDLMVVEYNKEVDPNWQPVEEAGGISQTFLKTYQSPYYSPDGDVTPKTLEQFKKYIGPEVDFSMLVMEALRRYDDESMEKLQLAFDENIGKKVGFNTIMVEAMMRADDLELEKLKSAFPEVWASISEGGGKMTRKTVTDESATEPLIAELPKIDALTDKVSLASGKTVFEKNCVSCHGKFGEGGIGPNFTDDYWIHGAGMANMVNIINKGVPAKGMISWRGVLKDNEIKQVASYILAMHGTNPPKAKKPQGMKVDYPLPE